jgi:hypothetical protein
LRDEQNKQLDVIVKAEHQRLQAKEKMEMEKREQARKRLAEVGDLLQFPSNKSNGLKIFGMQYFLCRT